MSDYKKLRDLAEAATPGPWMVEDSDAFSPIVIYAHERDLCAMDSYDHRPDERMPDARFIAASNPTTILALLDENDSLRAEVERLQESTERGNALLELHQVAREKSELATAVDLLESENNILTGEVMSLASRLDTLRAQLSAALAAKEEACDLFFTTPEQIAAGFDPAARIHALRSIGKDGGNG